MDVDRDVLFVEFGALGGVAESTATLAVELERRGFAVGVLSVSPSAKALLRWPVRNYTPSEFASQVVAPPVYRRLGSQHARRVVALARWALLSVVFSHRCWSLARTSRIVSVQGRLLSPLVLVLTAISRMRGATAVVTPHNQFSRWDGWVGRMDDMFLRAAARRASAVVLHGPLQEEVSDRTPTLTELPSVALRAPNPIPWHALSSGSARQPLGNASDARPILCTPGFIRRDKGIEAFATTFSASAIEAEYHVVGVPTDESVVRRLREFTDARIHVAPLARPLSSSEFVELLRSVSVVVLPYRAATGSGVLESCVSLGVPVVAAPFAAATELERAGAAVTTASSGEPEAVLEATRSWLSLPGTEQERRLERGRAVLARRVADAIAPYEALATKKDT